MDRPKVALIGCGAAGMFFLNALATRLKRDGDKVILPYVTCFERADQPGGCWRSPPSEDREQPQNVACWHDDIWCNVCKEAIEFKDYTFDEYFKGKPKPTFLPRSVLLDYVIKRTTKVDPNLYQPEGMHSSSSSPQLHELRFGTVVTHVRFDDAKQKFEIGSARFDPALLNGASPEPEVTEFYDYCVWAAGLRGKPRIPRTTLSLLRTGSLMRAGESSDSDDDLPSRPFSGTILHSIHAPTKLEEAVRGKRVVLIGDSNSAEELALQAVRFGVDKCYICSRSGYGDCAYMGSWPQRQDPVTGKFEPQVEVHVALPYRIVGDGKTLQCSTMEWNYELEVYEIDDEGEFVTLTDIDTIVLCTGFVPNMDFLSEDLNIHSEQLSSWFWAVPPDFKMRENPLTAEIGEVRPSSELSFSGNFVPGMYRTVLANNHRMLYIMDSDESEFPLIHLDALAWLCLAFITGEVAAPEEDEIEPLILHQMIEEMHIPYLRWSMDRNYFDALDELSDDHWTENYDDQRAIELNLELLRYYAGVLARDLRDAKHPLDLGEYGSLNEKGNKLVELGMQNILMRHLLDPSGEDARWRTYRDVDPTPFKSIYTGQPSTRLPRPWLEMKPTDVVLKDDKE